ncbi:hypothetical protein D3C79_756640 [compost metagenome]
MRIVGAVVDMIQHHVFNGDPPLVSIGFFQITANRRQEGFNIVLAVDRHDVVADLVVRRMQRNGQGHIDHIAQFVQSGHDTGGRQGNAALGQTKTKVIQHDFHRWHHVGQVKQWLTHAHHHHVGDRTLAGDFDGTQDFSSTPNLADDFRDTQVAVKALLSRGTEFALQCAAYL